MSVTVCSSDVSALPKLGLFRYTRTYIGKAGHGGSFWNEDIRGLHRIEITLYIFKKDDAFTLYRLSNFVDKDSRHTLMDTAGDFIGNSICNIR